ncbi:DNA replication complex GINS protein PSF2-like [Planoprotostelium fungivorum]|uniref:DNA replication complex GINS protein PSF2-like n=1 Tax=Planoprotostelium fungivorum TaxID=1890364 RepID=A0A2P6NHI2_9EUKA|nr:DNA replication complex GINS protein PSF2-like [Planoprotostelium fungivorum]
MQSLSTLSKIDDLKFFCGDEKITIQPKFQLKEAIFIGGTYGPFNSIEQCDVPFWLALELKRKQKCHIIVPEWLQADNLEKSYTTELAKKVGDPYEVLPYHYIEMATQLLEYASDDIPNVVKVRRLLEDLWTASITAGTSMIELNNLTGMELHNIRPIITQALTQFQTLSDSMLSQ